MRLVCVDDFSTVVGLQPNKELDDGMMKQMWASFEHVYIYIYTQLYSDIL